MWVRDAGVNKLRTAEFTALVSGWNQSSGQVSAEAQVRRLGGAGRGGGCPVV